ncbi:MAG: flagellar export protein FliJ [Alphaproteobacteria bacterium]
MSALNSLVRVHSWALDEKRQKLAQLDGFADKLRADLLTLEQELVQEQTAASGSAEGSIAFPAFVAAALERRKRLRESIANIELACEAAREEVNQAFQEMKKFELARDKQMAEEQEEAARREQANMDEMGIDIHRRNNPTDPE